jgi:hypothetical protein
LLKNYVDQTAKKEVIMAQQHMNEIHVALHKLKAFDAKITATAGIASV